MRFSVGVKFCKAFISKNYALDSAKSPLATLKKDLDLNFIPVIERRRLSEASKITLGLLGKSPLHSPIVFSSQKGEINRCFGMLSDLSVHHFTSPTAFSLSVLNATPALLAIAHKNHSEILAISAVDCFEYGLINAYALLCESAADSVDSCESATKDCLVISYEEKLISKEISAIIVCVSLEANLPQIEIKKRESHSTKADSHESNAKCANLGSNLSFLSAVATKIPRYENSDFAVDLGDFAREFSIEKL